METISRRATSHRRVTPAALLVAVAALIGATAHAQQLVITIAPGNSPAGGVVPLSAFGVGPASGVTDDGVIEVDVPAFSWAGESWTKLGLATNGFLLVGGGTAGGALNPSLPNAAKPNNVLAPFWTDLDPSKGGTISLALVETTAQNPDKWIVAEWNAISNFSTSGVNTFQVWIGLDGDGNPGEDVTFVYGSVTAGDNGLLTVGAEDKTGTAGTNYYYNGVGTLPVDGTQLRVSTAVVPEPSTYALVSVFGVALLVARRRSRARA